MSTTQREAEEGEATAVAEKYVYFFGEGQAEGDGSMRDVLGGKGAGLHEMTRISASTTHAGSRNGREASDGETVITSPSGLISRLYAMASR